MTKIIALRNALRFVGIAGSLVFALVLGVGFAKASISVGGGNDTTGPNSENQNEWLINHSDNITVENSTFTSRDQTLEVNAGNTCVGDNTEVGDIALGDITGRIEVENVPNSGDIHLMSLDTGNINIDFANDTTGPNSENRNDVTIEADHNVDVTNTSNIHNNVNLHANSGNNEVNNNTVVGDVSTGDISFTVDETNEANNGMGDLNLSGVGTISVTGDLTNDLTGPSSTNINRVRVNANSDVNIRNNAEINNNTNIEANSGNNSIGHNTVVGDISTGSVNIVSTTSNMAN